MQVEILRGRVVRQGQCWLDELSLSFTPGERVLIVGHTGAGKTACLKALAGLEPLSSGELLWDGLVVHALPPPRRRPLQQRFGMVFQSDALFDSLSALDNAALPLRFRQLSRSEQLRRASSALEQVGLLEAARALPDELSGGMRKRLGVARAIVGQPDVLLADDPQAGLDPATAEQLGQLLSRVCEGKTLIVCAPEAPLGLSFSRWIELAQGRVVSDSAGPLAAFASFSVPALQEPRR